MRPRKQQSGMTLIEVLVAFAILAGLSLSVLTLIGQNAQYMLIAEERMLASVAADNLLIGDLAVAATPPSGFFEGETTLANRSFVFTRTVTEIGNNAVFIEYSLRNETSPQTLARVSALKEGA